MAIDFTLLVSMSFVVNCFPGLHAANKAAASATITYFFMVCVFLIVCNAKASPMPQQSHKYVVGMNGKRSGNIEQMNKE
jgi:hypothetical protein